MSEILRSNFAESPFLKCWFRETPRKWKVVRNVGTLGLRYFRDSPRKEKWADIDTLSFSTSKFLPNEKLADRGTLDFNTSKYPRPLNLYVETKSCVGLV